MPIELAPLEEKGGHKIQRRVTETFLPVCAICKRAVWDYELDTEDEARRMLVAHVSLNHHGDPLLEKLATTR